MKQEYQAFKSTLARIVYKRMYKDNYEPGVTIVKIISNNINEVNKRALLIKEKIKHDSTGKYCVTTFESPIRKIDSTLNKKALNIRISKPLTSHST